MKTDLEQLKDFILNTQTMAEQGECLMLNVTDILNEIERLHALTIPDVVNRRELLVDFAMKRNNAPDFIRGQYERDADEYLSKIN